MFIPRIWANEIERLGKQRCTPSGYRLQVVGELIGFIGLLLLLGIPAYLTYRVIVGSFGWSLLWLMAVPFVIGIVGWVTVEISWWMARRKNFHYDRDRCESTWIQDGVGRSCSLSDWEASECRQTNPKTARQWLTQFDMTLVEPTPQDQEDLDRIMEHDEFWEWSDDKVEFEFMPLKTTWRQTARDWAYGILFLGGLLLCGALCSGCLAGNF